MVKCNVIYDSCIMNIKYQQQENKASLSTMLKKEKQMYIHISIPNYKKQPLNPSGCFNV